MIRVYQNGEVYEVSFKYDPTLVNIIKQVPGKQWLPKSKLWTIPVDRLGFLLNQLKGTMYEEEIYIQSQEHLGENAEIEQDTKIPHFDLGNTPFYVKEGATPYAHQWDFMRYALDRQSRGNYHGFLLCDEPGLAKTASTMNLAIYNQKHLGFSRCLIICCVNPAKYHWQDDIKDHSRGRYIPYILGTRRKKRSGKLRRDTGNVEKLEDLTSKHQLGDESKPILPFFIIMNIEGLRYKVGKSYPITDAIINLCNSGEIDMIAIDEVHKNMSPSSTQGKQIDKIKQKVSPNIMWIPITGTPITSRPTDVYLPLKLVNGHRFTSYYSWCNKFCVYGGFGDHEIIGYKNIPYLKELLEGNMLRRLKKNVLDLPEKIYYTEYVENTDYQDRLYESVAEGLIAKREQIMIRLRQVNGSPELIDDSLSVDKNYIKKNAKIERLLILLDEIHDRGEKVIIFSNWVEPLRTIYQIIKDKYKCCIYTGTMREDVREKHKQVFLHNPKYTVMLGTIGALGTIHTLTSACNAIFYDEPWTPTDKQQAEDRIHRIGTKTSPNIYTIITKDTMDERVHDILYKKEGIANYIVDNIDIHNDPELFDLLLSDTLKKATP